MFVSLFSILLKKKPKKTPKPTLNCNNIRKKPKLFLKEEKTPKLLATPNSTLKHLGEAKKCLTPHPLPANQAHFSENLEILDGNCKEPKILIPIMGYLANTKSDYNRFLTRAKRIFPNAIVASFKL